MYPERVRIFLDCLPEDVHENLAKLLLSTTDSSILQHGGSRMDQNSLKSLLAYAKGSDVQSRVAMRTMGNKISPCFWKRTTLQEWVSTCVQHIFEVNLQYSRNLTFERSFLRLPNLRKATILSLRDQLSAIRGNKALKELTIKVHTASVWDEIIAAIVSLPLKTLRMDVDIIYANAKLEKLPKIQLIRLGKACPAVTHFELTGFFAVSPNIWSLITSFRALKKLGLKAKIGMRQMLFLRRLSEVDLYEPMLIKRAAQVGNALVGATQKTEASAQALARLSACPRLRRLNVTLHENAEAALIGVIDNVEELCLSWKFQYTISDIHAGAQINANQIYPKYCEPDGAVLESIVRRARQLKSLKIDKAIVKMETVEKLLSIAGRSLEKFEIHIDWQKEPAVARIEHILNSVARYCPRLRTLHLLETVGLGGLVPILASVEQKESCLTALSEIMVSASKFASHRALHAFIQQRFVSAIPLGCLIWDDLLA